MILFYQAELPQVNYLNEEESKHCIKVLRKQVGDKIQIVDGAGQFYTAEINDGNPKKCSFKVIEVNKEIKSPFHRHLAIAPTKNMDRMEWLVEKAVELGIDEISFIQCEHSERKILKIDRLEKKAIGAMKQSIKSFLPKINPLSTFKDILEKANEINKCIAFVDFENPNHFKQTLSDKNDTIILIGPEGDFSKTEVDAAMHKGFKKVSLGRSRLRTETAGIAAVHLMNLAIE